MTTFAKENYSTMNGQRIRTLSITFNTPISFDEVPYFRGAVLRTVRQQDSLLYHNHLGDDYRYAYPLIQYKRIQKRAAIICVGDGTEAIGHFFANRSEDVMLGNRPARLEIDTVRAHNTLVQLWQQSFHYSLRRWLPLNQENYRIYQSTEGLADRCAMLERLLTANILSMLKTFGIRLDAPLQVNITQISQPRILAYKGIKMMGFDICFSSNISLPDFIGLGKGASLGFGTLTHQKQQTNNEE